MTVAETRDPPGRQEPVDKQEFSVMTGHLAVALENCGVVNLEVK